jgi:hypothetical protein
MGAEGETAMARILAVFIALCASIWLMPAPSRAAEAGAPLQGSGVAPNSEYAQYRYRRVRYYRPAYRARYNRPRRIYYRPAYRVRSYRPRRIYYRPAYRARYYRPRRVFYRPAYRVRHYRPRGVYFRF